MKRTLLLSLLCCSSVVSAADVVYPMGVYAESSQQMCINRASAHCVNTICLNSSDRDCIPKCQKMGVDKCK